MVLPSHKCLVTCEMGEETQWWRTLPRTFLLGSGLRSRLELGFWWHGFSRSLRVSKARVLSFSSLCLPLCPSPLPLSLPFSSSLSPSHSPSCPSLSPSLCLSIALSLSRSSATKTRFRLLLSNGATVDARNSDQATPLHFASQVRSAPIPVQRRVWTNATKCL